MAGRFPNRTSASRAVAEWRGYREPRPVLDRVQPVGALLVKTMQALGLGDRVREGEVLAAWKDIVGDFIAANSLPDRLKEGVLYVRVLQPTIRFELERLRPQMVAKLKERFGVRTVREVRFLLG